MIRYWWLLPAFVAGVLAGSALFGEDDAERDRQREEAQRMKAQAQGWHQIANAMQPRVDTQVVIQRRRDTVTRRETDSILVVLERENPGCANVVRACEDRLTAERANAAKWEELFHVQRDTITELRRLATDTALAAADSGIKASAGTRRSLWKILTRPEVQPGAFAGYCTTGKPCAGIGATLIWRF